MKVLEKLKIVDNIKLEPKFQVIVLKQKTAKNSFNGKILGRELSDWVAFACKGLNIRVIDYDGKNSILDFIKCHVDCLYDFSIILLSTTPLIENSVIKNIVEYSIYKKINICKLPVGYVVRNEYLVSQENMHVDSLYSQDIDGFYVVENKKQFNYALEVLQDRINDFHTSNGVEIIKPKSVYIEPEVDIDSGVVIYPNSSIKGKSVIGENVIIKENCVIDNSKIGDNSAISGSVINNSIIQSSVYISSFCEIDNCLIGAESSIESGCKIKNYKLGNNSKVKANQVLGDTDDSDSRTGKSR